MQEIGNALMETDKVSKFKRRALYGCEFFMQIYKYLEISVNDPPVVAVLDGREDLPEFPPGCLLRHASIPGDVVWNKSRKDWLRIHNKDGTNL